MPSPTRGPILTGVPRGLVLAAIVVVVRGLGLPARGWSDEPQVRPPTAEGIEFFEKRIRPILVDRCLECHGAGAKEVQGELLLDSREGWQKGGATGPAVVPGDPDRSLLIQAVRGTSDELQMPPDTKLSGQEIADLETWVRLGAPDPRESGSPSPNAVPLDPEQALDFWSLRPITDPRLPQTQTPEWSANGIDRFLISRWEQEGLTPAVDAERSVWLRRVTYDLLGLPPTPEELDAFLADEAPDAQSRVVDRLLGSPHYGERWGRYWLDVVRYADTAGDNSDFPIPQMYRYRNWVIEALNRDLAYDDFVREQLAGDLLGGETAAIRNERTIATGYIANARRFGSRVDDYPQHLTIEDTLDNLGRAFLAVTINCARCHNHKFDPVSTADYYALYGIFHSTRYPWPGIELEQHQRDLVPLIPPEEVESLLAERREQKVELQAEVTRLKRLRDEASGDAREDLDKQLSEAEEKLDEHNKVPPPFEQAYAVVEGSRIEDVAIQHKGDPTKLGPVVRRRFLTMLGGPPLPESDATSGRLALANWIVDSANPLGPRVIANRIWLSHFGKGLVATPNDFGRQGRRPTHPELLDWLARELMNAEWSIKTLHRTILSSHAYQLSSGATDELAERDPANELLAVFPRRRLDAEAIRDTLLLLGGKLDTSPGGPHPFPDPRTWKFTQHNPFKAIYETNRRSIYLMTQRIQRHPYLGIFDAADPSFSTPARSVSTTPLQALYLLNDPFVHDQARGLAVRLLAAESAETSRVELAYRLALARKPAAEEVAAAVELVHGVHAQLAETGVSPDDRDVQSWEAFCRALFRLNELVYID